MFLDRRSTRFQALLVAAALWAPANASAVGMAASRWVGGMLLESRSGRVVVARILEGSAAARAGLKTGDTILVVGNRAVADLDRPDPVEVLEIFDHIPADPVRLVIGRGPGTLGVLLDARAPDARSVAGVASPLEPGAVAPAFEARALGGRPVALAALRGRPVLIDFWASWCPPCRDAALVVRRMADQYGERLAIVGVSLDDNHDAFEAFVYNRHLPGSQVFDGGPRGPVTTLYGAAVAGLPFAVLIAPDGTIAASGRSPHALEPEIERLLGDRAGSRP